MEEERQIFQITCGGSHSSRLIVPSSSLECTLGLHAWVLSHFSHVWLLATLWTVAHWVPLSKGFSRLEYWSGLPCPPPRDLPNPGTEPRSHASFIGRWVLHNYQGNLLDPRIEPASPATPTLRVDSSPADPLGKPMYVYTVYICIYYV